MLVSSDGYSTIVSFDEGMPHYATQQRDLQLKSVALAHSHGLISHNQHQGLASPMPSAFALPHAPSPALSTKELPGPTPNNPLKRPASAIMDPPLTPAPSVSGELEHAEIQTTGDEPAKKKRRVALRHHGAV